ncbi:MAG: hypothetical protein WCI77_05870 [Candidatus Omnitrophota bacterium]
MKKISNGAIVFCILSFLTVHNLHAQEENTDSPATTSQEAASREVVEKANAIMKNIYTELWRLKSKYKELEDFGPQNYSDTPQMPVDYQKIKSIRLESSRTSEVKRGFFSDRSFRGDRDEFYICFSDTAKAFGTTTLPNFYGFVKSVGLYLLVFTTTENRHLEYDLRRILKDNVRSQPE